MALPTMSRPNECLLGREEAAETTAATIRDAFVRKPEHARDGDREIRGSDLFRIAFVAAAAAAVWFRLWEPLPSFSLIGVLATLIGGYPIFRKAFENILERRMTMELSMTIALVAALLIHESFTALVITLFVLVAEVLEGMTVGRGRKAIHELVRFLPRTAVLVRNGASREVPISALKPGDLVLVRPGSRIPVDGPLRMGPTRWRRLSRANFSPR